MGRNDEAQETYEKAVADKKASSTTLGNYANFLKNVIRDNERAKKYYLLALAADPTHEAAARN